MSTQPQSRLSPEEYLALERKAEHKSEFYQGETFAMPGATYRHNLISSNIGGELRARLRGTECTALIADMRVATSETGLYTYPDIAVVCGQPRFRDQELDTLLNPAVLVEVLSPSTQNYDRGLKFEMYRTIPTLHDYILVAQDRVHVEHHSRQPDDRWLLWETNDAVATVVLSSLGIALPLSEIYAGAGFAEFAR
jgi:Uma2 family endonuclease